MGWSRGLNPRENSNVHVPLLRYSCNVTSRPPAPAIMPPCVYRTPQTVSQNRRLLLKLLLVKYLLTAMSRATNTLSETSTFCISLSMLVLLMPPERPIKLCVQHFRISLTHGCRVLHIPPTNQFQKLQVYNGNTPTVVADGSIRLLSHYCDQY